MSAGNQSLDPNTVIKACVHGTRPWGTLKDIGITVKVDGARQVYENPHGHKIAVLPEDLAQGLTRLRNNSPQLRQWADVILGASNFIELSGVEDQPYGQALVEALWDLSAGEPIRESALLAARELFVDGS